MYTFLVYIEIYSLPKLNQDEVNRPITSIKIEKVIKNLVNKKSDRFSTEFYQTFQELILVFLKFPTK